MSESILPAYIDSTMMNTFRSCEQKFFAEFALGLRESDKSIDLHAGAVFSATLEEFYTEVFAKKTDVATALARAYGRFILEWKDVDALALKPSTAKTQSNMWAAVESYVAKYPPATDHIQPFMLNGSPSVEFSFSVPLEPCGPVDDGKCFPLHPITNEPFLYVGRFDMLGEYNKQVAIRDEKTASRMESNWSDKWNLRAQFLGYCWALQQSGIRCSTAIVRGIVILKRDINHVEAIKLYPQHLIERWHEGLRRDLWRLVTAWNTQYFNFNLGETCTAYGLCPFMDRCTAVDPNQWNNSYSVKRWNPLDRNPTSGTPLSTHVAKIASRGFAVSSSIMSEPARTT